MSESDCAPRSETDGGLIGALEDHVRKAEERIVELRMQLKAAEARVRQATHSGERWFKRTQKARRQHLNALEALRYWLPDETMIPRGHEDAWHEHVKLLREAVR